MCEHCLADISAPQDLQYLPCTLETQRHEHQSLSGFSAVSVCYHLFWMVYDARS